MRIGSVVLAFASANALPGRVAAAAPPCTGVRVHGALDLAPEWTTAVRELVSELPPVEEGGCAAVTLSIEPAPERAARLSAMAADGRYAERTLLRPSALAATALGLVASIPPESAGDAGAGPGETPSVHGEAPSGPAPGAPPSPPASTTPAAAAELPKHVELWLGISSGVRIGESTPVQMFDFEARADAVVTRWLLTLSLRYAPSFGPDNSDFTYEEVELALGAGRRIPLGRGALDLSVLPGLVTMNMQWDEDTSTPRSGGSSAFRLGLSGRWSTPVSDTWRFTVTVDGDVTPAGLDHALRPGIDAPELPAWTAGLRVGASGALL